MRVQVAKSLQFPGKFVLVDQKTMKRVDYPEIDSSSEALQEALQYNKEWPSSNLMKPRRALSDATMPETLNWIAVSNPARVGRPGT